MSVFDVAKNNRGNDVHTVTMSYKTFDEYLHKAQEELKDELIAIVKYREEKWPHKDYSPTDVIDLIKGDNNG